MRMLALFCLVPLAACVWDPAAYDAFAACSGLAQDRVDVGEIAFCAGLQDKTRVDGLIVGADGGFTYSAHTNMVMTENDDGAAERIRREWLTQALKAHAVCEAGYLIDDRRLVQQPIGPFANGGDIVYIGRCL